MVNTVVQRTVVGAGADRNIIRTIHIISDGSEESNLIIYDNSTLVNNVLKGSLKKVWVSGSDCVARFSWDQTTDVAVFAANPSNGGFWDFSEFGGLANPGATGATGDLFLNTANLDAGDELMIIIHITQN